ncbi:CmpA/NrtA family ABC transporter substrate-binding protein [Paraperlucidibaca wandonensis]|uniref:CmpA/NrtA family ABC transporter substrate-binding protein n=1 Tax=Paraperlucidibaca wandonensis TaxID=1268273 RepID=A0ABW3HC68_9GAMM
MSKSAVVRIGYMPLTDSLPLLAAEAWGYFADEGVQVALQCETSWATLRDRLTVGQIDAAPLLAPMVLSTTLGLAGLQVPLMTAYGLGRNGNAITVSKALFSELSDVAVADSPLACAHALADCIRQRRQRHQKQLVWAVVFPFSSHAYLLRYWLASAGIDPDQDIKMVVLPPSQMADHLRLGHIDGFCSGEPWNSWALMSGAGQVLLTGHQIWQNAPEKVLGVSVRWAEQHPQQHAALVRALFRAGERVAREPEAALGILAEQYTMAVPQDCLALPFQGRLPIGLAQQPVAASHFHQFGGADANFPWQSQARWLLLQMHCWQQLPERLPSELIASCWRPDCYREFLHDLTDAPCADAKVEGEHDQSASMAGVRDRLAILPDAFIDAACYPSVLSP